MEREIICLSCPNGCHLNVRWTDRTDVQVTGGKCERGDVYAHEEVFEPKRVVTAVVRTNCDTAPYLPVKTDAPLAKPLIPALLNAIYGCVATSPIRIGDRLINDFQGSGVNVVFSSSSPD